jgi:hypothetical protein
MSSGNDGVFQGCWRRPRRRVEATPAGPETRSTAGTGGGRGSRESGLGGRAQAPDLVAVRFPLRGGPGLPRRAMVAEGAQDQADHLVQDRPVHGAGDDGHDHRIARRRLRVGAGQVAALAQQRPDPRRLQAARARHRPQVPQRDVHRHLRISA